MVLQVRLDDRATTDVPGEITFEGSEGLASGAWVAIAEGDVAVRLETRNYL